MQAVGRQPSDQAGAGGKNTFVERRPPILAIESPLTLAQGHTRTLDRKTCVGTSACLGMENLDTRHRLRRTELRIMRVCRMRRTHVNAQLAKRREVGKIVGGNKNRLHQLGVHTALASLKQTVLPPRQNGTSAQRENDVRTGRRALLGNVQTPTPYFGFAVVSQVALRPFSICGS